MQIRYSQDHQYVIVEDGVGTVGISNYAQEKLSDVTTVELPHVGAQVQKGGAVGVVESVKAANDFYSPVDADETSLSLQRPQPLSQRPKKCGTPTRLARLFQPRLSASPGSELFRVSARSSQEIGVI
jgi:glycine cleavage system H protein